MIFEVVGQKNTSQEIFLYFCSSKMKWATVWLKKEGKFRYVEIAKIRGFDVEEFSQDEKAGSMTYYEYEASDNTIKKCQVLMVNGI